MGLALSTREAVTREGLGGPLQGTRQAASSHVQPTGSALQLAQAREKALPRGTPYLATLYAAHAGALHRLAKADRVPAPQRADVARQAAAALQAAARIRQTCFGADHPLTLSTLAAARQAAANAACREKAGA